MKLKFHIFLDRRQLFFAAITVLFGYGAVTILTDPSEVGFWWLLCVGLAFLFLTGAAIHPCLYVMTDEGLYSFYLFGFVRRFIPWNTVRKLEVCYPKSSKRIPYFDDTFVIHGKAQGKEFFFTENEIVRTRRARRLLERYTGFPVEGFMIDDLRTWRKKRKEKKERMRRRRERMERVERNRKAKEVSQKDAKTAKKQAGESKKPTQKKGKEP